MSNKFFKCLPLLLLFFICSCTNRDMSILIEEPNSEILDGKEIVLKINGKEIYRDYLKTTDIASKYQEALFYAEKDDRYKLEVELGEQVFQYDFLFPEERYIILSPGYFHNKISVGILKQKDKFILH